MTARRRLVSPGPVADGFMRSRAFIAGIIGPVGSGKTMAMLQKGLRGCAMQGGRKDDRGVTWRKARFGVIRESYPNLEANTLKSWFNIVPEDEGKFSWKAPYVHAFRKVLRRDGERRPVDILECEVEFRAIGDKSVEEITRGWEVNVVGIDEYDLQPPDLLSFLSGRVGRFSNLDPSLVIDPQILCSLNMPYIDNHAYRLLVEKELGELDPEKDMELASALEGRPLVETFIQPGGRDPKAENLHNLRGGRGYYAIQVAVNRHKPGYIDRMVDNRPVPMQHGTPVYGGELGFRFSEHVAPEGLKWDRRFKVIVGLDQGLYAAAVFLQRVELGELRVLDEAVITAEDGKQQKIGAAPFGKLVRAKLFQRFPDITEDEVRFVADPAAFASKDNPDAERGWLKAVEASLGFRIHRAKTNSEAVRLEAVRRQLAERGGYLVDQRCKRLIRAHLGGYRYAKAELSTAGEHKGHLQIADTEFTHIADAEQYAALEGEHVVAEIMGRRRRGQRGHRGRVDYGDGYFSGGMA